MPIHHPPQSPCMPYIPIINTSHDHPTSMTLLHAYHVLFMCYILIKCMHFAHTHLSHITLIAHHHITVIQHYMPVIHHYMPFTISHAYHILIICLVNAHHQVSHICHMPITFTSHIYHLRITLSNTHHMPFICSIIQMSGPTLCMPHTHKYTSYLCHMPITFTSYVNYSLITNISHLSPTHKNLSHVHNIAFTRPSHVCPIYTTCSLNNYHMFTASPLHPHHTHIPITRPSHTSNIHHMQVSCL